MNTDRRVDPIRLVMPMALGLILLVCAPQASAATTTTLCTSGSGSGQCSAPAGLALDTSEGEAASGRLYLADSGNDRVDVFKPNDEFDFSFGGEGASRLSAPSSVAVDPTTHEVYVADFGNRRIEKFDDEGNFLLAIGEGEYASSNAMLVALSPAGKVIVADSSTAAHIRLREYEPGGGAPLRTKAEVATSTELGGLVVDSNGAVYMRGKVVGGESLCRYDGATWEPLFCFAAADAEGVAALALGGEDHLFDGGLDSADTPPPRESYRVIAEYDQAGTALRRFGYGVLEGGRGGNFVDGLAIRGEERVYVSLDHEKALVLPFPPRGPIATAPGTEGITSFKATIHVEVNPEGKEAEYAFQYLTQAQYEEQGNSFEGPATRETEPGILPAGMRLERAEALIGCPNPQSEAGEGRCLAPETQYRWRLVAETEAGRGEGEIDGGAFTTTKPLEVLEVWPTAVGTDAATLHVRVNAFGVPATGWFEYATEAAYEADRKAGGDGFAGAARVPAGAEELHFGAEEGATAAATASGLSEGAAYRFRVTVTNPLLEAPLVGEEHRAFATLAPSAPLGCAEEGTREGLVGARFGEAAFLPDCRAYEMVSPVDKNGGDIVFFRSAGPGSEPAAFEQSSTDGARIAYTSLTSFAEPAGAPLVSQYLSSRRAGEGWETHDVSSPRGRLLTKAQVQLDTEFEAFSPDLCSGWLRTIADPPLLSSAPPGTLNLYRRTSEPCGGPAYEAITTIAPPHVTPSAYSLELQGFSADGTRAIYRGNDTLEGSGAPSEPSGCASSAALCESRLYSHSLAEGTRYVCILPGGANASSCAAGTSEPRPGGAVRTRTSSLANAISADGRRIFWSTPAPGEGRLYVSENPGAAQSPRVHGAATGSGDVVGPARGTGRILKSQALATGVKLEAGGFVVGQEVADSAAALPAGTKIEALEIEKEEEVGGRAILYYRLTFDHAAEKNALSDTFTGLASVIVGALDAETGAFQAGQRIEGPGIPVGTTVESCSPECGQGARSLTLSALATSSREGAALEASSPCVRPLAGACTSPVSLPAEIQDKTSASRFWGAARDGSVAIFSTGRALYGYEVEGESVHWIAGKLNGVAGIDEAADRVYFASEEAIPGAGRNSVGAEARAGEPNLYLYEAAAKAGEEGSYAFVGTLAGTDIETQARAFGPVATSPTLRLSRVTPSGGTLAFMSAAPLTGFDNADAVTGEPDRELFLYQVSSGKLLCASCSPTGARPVSFNPIRGSFRAAGAIPPGEDPLYASRPLSEDGRRLFFTSAERLVARDTDGRVDLYQWEAPGEGSCSAASSSYVADDGGCIDLISSGRLTRDAEFRDASPSGEDVFFATSQSLLPQDPGLVDIYDARVGGGLPIPQPPAPTCEGEACQSPPAPPNDPTPASSAFEGAGNVRESAAKKQKAKRCKKGRHKVKKHGKVRCVRKAHRKTHRAHHRKKGHGGNGRPRTGRGGGGHR